VVSTSKKVFLALPVLALVGLGALVAWFGVFARYRQPSASMYPAFRVGDHFTVNRFDKTPVRGAVMVFRYPEHPDQEFDKRIIGLPGDVIVTKGPIISINGWEIPRCPVGSHSFKDEMGAEHRGTLDVEFLGDATYLVYHESFAGTDFGPFTVKPNEYFVMGDNRENSHDSRMWFGGVGGGVPFENTVGHARTGLAALPPGAEPLKPALDACLSKKPSKTTP
jgi:signal peptidase I